MLDQRRPMPIEVDQRRLGWAVRRRGSVKVGTSVPMGGSECSESTRSTQARAIQHCIDLFFPQPSPTSTLKEPLALVLTNLPSSECCFKTAHLVSKFHGYTGRNGRVEGPVAPVRICVPVGPCFAKL
jgi:hypothetical protein